MPRGPGIGAGNLWNIMLSRGCVVDGEHRSLYRAFLKDLYLLCRKHGVEIDGRLDDGPCNVSLDGASSHRLFVSASLASCVDTDDDHTLTHLA